MRLWVTLLIFAATLSTASAQEKYPREIEKIFETARKECRRDMAGADANTTATFKPTAVRKLDLTGDGRDDYIVDFGQASCDDNHAFFCGSGGCYLTILVAKPGGRLVEVFKDQVLDYELSGGRGARTITLNLHHNDCSYGQEFCVKKARITGKPLRLRELREPKYPPEVEEQLEQARKECRAGDGKEVTFGPKTVRKLDLTGDKRDDYIVDLDWAKCDAFESLYCGTGGCNVAILVGKPDGSLVTVFDGRVRKYHIMPGKGARTIRFDLHGGYCGKAVPYACPNRMLKKPIGGSDFY